jgi:ABC-type antimicrobial peptide transport system permease subunit
MGAGIHELRALAPANLPRLDNIRMDRFVLGYTALAGLEAAAIFGIAPAWRASRPELMDVLRGRTSGLASGAVLRNLVAGVGLYGLLATAVWQRTSEIGVRMTLGAERSDILRLVVLQGVRLSVIFFAVEAVAAFVLARVISAMLVGVKPADPVIFASMAVVFFAISALASWLPARRAAGFDPPDRPARTVRLF